MDYSESVPFGPSATGASSVLNTGNPLPAGNPLPTNAAFPTNRNFPAAATNTSSINNLMNAQLNNSTSNLGNFTNLNSGSPLTSDSFAVVNSLNKYVNNRTDL